jgi:hypothetical protein
MNLLTFIVHFNPPRTVPFVANTDPRVRQFYTICFMTQRAAVKYIKEVKYTKNNLQSAL